MNTYSENRISATRWNFVDWRKAETEVRRLRQRIYRAERLGNARRVRSLQRLMLKSYSNRLMSVRRVTQHNRGKNTPGSWPAKKGEIELRAKIRTIIRKHRAAPQSALAKNLAAVTRGWANYYKYSSATKTFARLDHHLWWLTWQWAKRRHPKKGKRWVKKRYRGTYAPGRRNHWVFNQVRIIRR